MRLRLRTADAGGKLEVVAGIDEIVEGLIRVQMDLVGGGRPRTLVTIELNPEDVLVDEDAAKTREMKLVPVAESAGGRLEEVHEHGIPLGSFGGSE